MDDEARDCYEQHVTDLLRLASSLVGPSGAEDLVSSLFVRVFAGEGWRAAANRRAYLCTALVNLARSQHRSTQRRLRREARHWQPSTTEATAPVRPEVLAAVRHLSVRQRAIVFLTYWEDLDPAAVAVHLDVSRQTVSRELITARSILGRHLS